MSHLDPGVLHALLDGEIPSGELAELQAHLAGCAECRARLAEEREIFGEAGALVESLEVPAKPPKALPAPRTRRRVNWIAQAAWAASVLMAGGLGYAMRVVMSPRGAQILQVSAEHPAPAGLAAESVSRRDAASARPSAERPAAPAPASPVLARAPRKEAAPERGLADTSRDFAEPRGKIAATAGAAAPAAAAPTPLLESAAQNQAKASVALRGLGSLQHRLQEVVVPAAERGAPVTIPYPDAVARLGGRLRQIEGLIPRRLEAQGDTIRVVYRVGTREVVLVQRRSGDEIQVSLEAPPGFPTDSLDLLRTLVRD